MNKKSLGIIALLFLLPAVASISCGSGDGTYIELPLNPDGSPAVDTDSYLPLTPGIVSSFFDDPVTDHTNWKFENLTASVREDQTIKIQAVGNYDGWAGNVQETLYFREEGNKLLLTGYDAEKPKEDGLIFGNSRRYDPPVVILEDKTTIHEGDEYRTEHVNVDFEGDPEQIATVSWTGEIIELEPASDYSDITTTVKVEWKGTDSIYHVGPDIYHISLVFNSAEKELWFPYGFISNGEFGLAKGIGIVHLAGYDVVHTNAAR